MGGLSWRTSKWASDENPLSAMTNPRGILGSLDSRLAKENASSWSSTLEDEYTMGFIKKIEHQVVVFTLVEIRRWESLSELM